MKGYRTSSFHYLFEKSGNQLTSKNQREKIGNLKGQMKID